MRGVGSFGSPLANQTERLFLIELNSGKATVRSLGVLYGMLMGAARDGDHSACAFRGVNRAIQDHYGDGPFGKLEAVKKCAWDFFERATQGIEARSAETGTGSVHESPVRNSECAQNPAASSRLGE